jgi:hypothetical protein
MWKGDSNMRTRKPLTETQRLRMRERQRARYAWRKEHDPDFLERRKTYSRRNYDASKEAPWASRFVRRSTSFNAAEVELLATILCEAERSLEFAKVAKTPAFVSVAKKARKMKRALEAKAEAAE